ncbi:MAG: hypothetical protein HOP08_20030 [Cyclobacteriaceae bacterium]|nr:hypothetical protein [Cyclobacteriaceae bacterium]
MNKQLRAAVLITTFIGYFSSANAQQDSVVIRVGKESKVIFSIKDKKDLETLKHYNFQALMDDMVQKLEKGDSTKLTKSSVEYLKDTIPTTTVSNSNSEWIRDQDNDEDNYNFSRNHRRERKNRKTYGSFNIDVGMNNYLQDGKFPDASNQLYSVKPWGSWYVGLNSIWRTRMAKKLFLEWGGGVSWYNFKFNNTKTVISKDDNGVIFSEDQRDVDFQKSKLTAAYVNISAVPMLDFGDNSKKSTFFDGNNHFNSFRIGVGPYAGYLIDSYTKQMYYDNGDKRREHHHDNLYLNNIRYGLRLQIGFRDTDIFFNYDMNELFTENKGPKLQAFSFGITL